MCLFGFSVEFSCFLWFVLLGKHADYALQLEYIHSANGCDTRKATVLQNWLSDFAQYSF